MENNLDEGMETEEFSVLFLDMDTCLKCSRVHQLATDFAPSPLPKAHHLAQRFPVKVWLSDSTKFDKCQTFPFKNKTENSDKATEKKV